MTTCLRSLSWSSTVSVLGSTRVSAAPTAAVRGIARVTFFLLLMLLAESWPLASSVSAFFAFAWPKLVTLVRACVTKSFSVSIHVKELEAHVALRAFRRCDS